MNEDIESSSSSGELVEYLIKGQLGETNKKPTKENKVSFEDTHPKGPRKKNPTRHHLEHCPNLKRIVVVIMRKLNRVLRKVEVIHMLRIPVSMR